MGVVSGALKRTYGRKIFPEFSLLYLAFGFATRVLTRPAPLKIADDLSFALLQ
jgi:hypothetical protein